MTRATGCRRTSQRPRTTVRQGLALLALVWVSAASGCMSSRPTFQSKFERPESSGERDRSVTAQTPVVDIQERRASPTSMRSVAVDRPAERAPVREVDKQPSERPSTWSRLLDPFSKSKPIPLPASKGEGEPSDVRIEGPSDF